MWALFMWLPECSGSPNGGTSREPPAASYPLSLHVGHLRAQLYPDASLPSTPSPSLRVGPVILPFLSHPSLWREPEQKKREEKPRREGEKHGVQGRRGRAERDRNTSVQPPAAGDKPRPLRPSPNPRLRPRPSLTPAPPPRRTAGLVGIRAAGPPPSSAPAPRRAAGGHAPRCVSPSLLLPSLPSPSARARWARGCNRVRSARRWPRPRR
jgi:hypothetical protein